MFAELICRSNYSFLRGASHPEEFVTQALTLGYTSIALTDRNGVYGIPKAYWAAKNHPQLKLISGAEVILENKKSLFLLAKDRKGYGLMCRLITLAHAGKPKGEAFLKFSELKQLLNTEDSLGFEHLFALYAPECHDHPHAEVSTETAQMLKDIFKNNIYLVLSRFLDGLDDLRTQKTLKLAQTLGLMIMASNDVHFHVKTRARLHDALTCVRESTTLPEAGSKLFSNHERYLKPADVMKKLFHDLPEALANTLHIAQACVFSPAELRYRYPSEWIPKNHSAQSYLEDLVRQGALDRYKNGIPPEVDKQLKHELGLIQQLNFADYFLTIYEIVDFARSRDILCQGRGSAANSVVCYVLGITSIDPVRMNLLFERFISVERGEPPDIDVDFEHERREEVIQHIYEKYGRHRAAMVSAVITYRGRSSLREISKALGIHVGTLSAKKLERDFDSLVKTSPIPNCHALAGELIEEMRGFPRHLSIHSGGFTLSADPLTEIVPVEPARMEGRTIIQWDKYDLDYLGLLKVDILSLGMLSAIQKVLKRLNLKFHEIPPDDKATYKMIQKCDTVGVFQIESRAQMSMLGRLQPKSFYDLVVEIAIVRPGPISGRMVHPYLRRRQGIEKIEYHHPKLKTILGKTLGVPIFQEQVMKMAVELADFTPGESDQLRRAIGAWRSSGSITQVAQKLMDGLLRHGIPRKFAEDMFEYMKGFSQYGFPESHSASFALIAYASCYLKCHHPAEFTCALINSQPMGFYANHTLVDDVKRKGVRVLPVHPEHSQWDCSIEGAQNLRMGFRTVSGLSEKDFKHLQTGRPYRSFEQFLFHNQKLRKVVLQKLALGGSFECFKIPPREALWKLLDLQVQSQTPQLDFWQSAWVDPLKDETKKTSFESLTEFEAIREDYESFNLSTRGHPMQALRKTLNLKQVTTSQARSHSPESIVEAAGLLIIRQRPPTAKGTTFGTLEDEFGFLDLIIRKEVSEKNFDVFHEHCFLKVKGKIQRDGHAISMIVNEIRPVFKQSKELMIEPTQYYW